MPKFSWIVPIYNVEPYLKECIDSLIGQEFEDIEIILVNDGSTDNSLSICEDYKSHGSKRNSQIKIVDKENGGLASARNAGIRSATGDYLVFIDSDDYIADNGFLYCVNDAVEHYSPDLICYGNTKFRHGTGDIIAKRYDKLSYINSFPNGQRVLELNRHDDFYITAWSHIIRRRFLEENDLYFVESYKTGEDIEWIIHVLSAEPTIVGLDNAAYMYRVRPESITTSSRKSGFWKYRKAGIIQGIEEIKQSKASDEYKTGLYACEAYLFYILLGEISHEPDKDVKKMALESCKDLLWLKKYSQGKKSTMCKMILDVLGLHRGTEVIGKRV